MNFEIKDYIVDELNNNELTELIYSLVLYHRDNTIMNDDKFSSRIIRFAYKNVLYDFKQKTILDEKKKKRAEINRQNALKRWGKSVGTIVYTNGNANGDAIAYANKMQKLCKSNANRNENKMQDVSDKNISNEITIQKDIPVTANDNTNNNINNDAEDMRTLMQNVCKSDAKVMQNNFAKHTDNKEENIIINDANEMQNLCENNANKIANDNTNGDTNNNINDKKNKGVIKPIEIPATTVLNTKDDAKDNTKDDTKDDAKDMQTNTTGNDAHKKSFKSLMNSFMMCYNEQAQKKDTETSPVITDTLENDTNIIEEQKDSDKAPIKTIGSLLKDINLPKVDKLQTNANEMQNLCESNANENAIAYAKPMRKLCKNNANIMRNYATENSHKPFDMKKEIELFNKLNSNANCNANGNANGNANCNANEYANEYANDHANNIEDKVVPCSSENKENTIPTSDLKPVSYASEKGNILSVDNLLNDDDGSINEETDLSVQKIKEKEKRSKKEKENIYNNNIYNNKYIYNNIFKEEKENLIKEKEESKNTDNNNIYVNETEKKENSVSNQEKEKNVTQEEYKLSEQIEQKSKRFKAPTVEEVRAYILEKGYSIDAESFVDYYTSKGWVVGKSPMKDWKAAIRTWNKNHAKFNNTSTGNGYYANRPNRMLTPNEREAEAYADKLCQRLRAAGVLTEDNKPVDVDYDKR